MVVCIHLPRFELVIAAGGPKALAGRALAIAPAPGGQARVGEVSGAAGARGGARGVGGGGGVWWDSGNGVGRGVGTLPGARACARRSVAGGAGMGGSGAGSAGI